MNRSLALLVVGVCVVVVATFWLLRDQSDKAAAPQTANQLADVAPAPERTQAAPVEPTLPPESERKELEVAIAPTTEVAPATKTADDGLAELRGRFVLPNGAPAIGVALKLHGWEANQERVIKFGAPKDWPEIDGTSDSVGRFAFRFDPPRAFQFALDAQLPGHAKLAWRWSELPQHAITDIGDIGLTLAGSIRGRIVDSSGKPVGGKWMVYGESTVRTKGAGSDEARVYSPADPVTSEFRLDGLPPGTAQLKANSRIANWVDGPKVEVRAGEEIEADITYNGPDNSHRIVVIPFCRPFYVFENDPKTIVLLGVAGGERVATKIEHSSQSWSFDDVPSGAYTVEIRDERFLPWSRAGVRSGQSIDAHLKGSAAVLLSVVDDEGKPIEPYRLRLRFRKVNFSPNEFEVRAAGAALPDGGLYDGLIPSKDFTLIVDAANKGAREVDVDALAPNETRAINIVLGASGAVHGRLTGAPAAVLAGASISLAPESVGADAALEYVQGVWSGSGTPTGIREVEADSDGHFVFEGLDAGRYVIAARVNAYLKIAIEAFEVAAGATKSIDIAMPPTSFVAGHLVVPQGTKFDRMVIDECTVDEASNPDYEGWMSFDGPPPPRTQVGADGRFRLGPLPAGEYRLSLMIADTPVPSDLRHWERDVATKFVLGIARVAPPADVSVEFDVRDKFPGSLAVSATVDGAPASGCSVTAEGTNPADPSHSIYARAQVGGDGVARFDAINPATWKLVLTAGDNSWTMRSEVSVTVAANTASAARIDATLYSGTLRVLDVASGKPLAQRALTWSTADGHGTRLQSDTNGVVTIRMPAGRYKIADQGDGDGFYHPGTGVDVDWTPSGPVPAEVRLEPAKKVDLKAHGQQ